MASCQTAEWVNTAPHAKLTVEESSSTATSVTLKWTLQMILKSAPQTGSKKHPYSVKINGSRVDENGDVGYDIPNTTGTKTIETGYKTISKGSSSKSVSFSVTFDFLDIRWSGVQGGERTGSGNITIAASSSYTISYNANGGTGAPSSQTKTAGTNITLSTKTPTRTGYTFAGWSTSDDTSVEYAPGATYSTNNSVTLYAVWTAKTYTVTYNANGGDGAPSSQRKDHGANLKLSTTKPTRADYAFKGWGTTSNATTVTYSPGGTYSSDANIILYAIWSSTYTAPRITGLTAVGENDASGSTTRLRVRFSWVTDKIVESVVVQWKLTSGSEWTSYTFTAAEASGTSGNVDKLFEDYELSVDSSYTVSITVSDESGETTTSRMFTGSVFSIDALPKHKGIAFGKSAEMENVMDVAYNAVFRHEATSYNDDTAYNHVHEKTGTGVGFGVGQGGINHGVYSRKQGNWLIYGTDTDTILDAHDDIVTRKPIWFNANAIMAAPPTSASYIRCKYRDDISRDLIARSANSATVYFGPDSSEEIGDSATNLRGKVVRLYAHEGGGVYLGYSGSTAITSDRNLKKDIFDLDDKYIEFFNNLRPISYKYNAKNNNGHRDHVGFIAQEVEDALIASGLTTEQFAGICVEKDVKLNPNYSTRNTDEENASNEEYYEKLYSLRYEEFIALNTHMIQQQQSKIRELESRLEKLEKLLETRTGE